MESLRVYKIFVILSLSVVLLVDLNIEARTINSKQSLSQLSRIQRNQKKKKDEEDGGVPVSENKLHFQSKLVIVYAITDYEVEFIAPQNKVESSRKNKTKQLIEIEEDVAKNSTADANTCRKEIKDRKMRWKMFLSNPPTPRIVKLKALVDSAKDQFTLEKFCESVAILYQRIKDDLDLEVREKKDSVDSPISSYTRTKFVIPFLLEDYPEVISKPVKELIAKELRKA